MKYLAILKDSLREALDSKIIYVMLGISAFAILIVASMSFTPGPADDLLRRVGPDFPHGFDVEVEAGPNPAREQKFSFQLRYEGHKVLNGSENSPDAEILARYQVPALDHFWLLKIQRDPEVLRSAVERRLNRWEKQEIFQIQEVRVVGLEKAPINKLPDIDKEWVGGIIEANFQVEVHLKPAPSVRRVWPHEVHILFGAIPLGDGAPLGEVLFGISFLVLRIGAWIAILIGVIITAFFIPNMLRKGTIDLLLVKPIHRWALLFYKYLGGLVFIFLNTAFVIGGIWLVLGLRSGIWANGFLLTIFGITFFFAILYAVSTLFAVLTQSAVVSILVTCGAWFLFFIVGILYQEAEMRRNHPEMFGKRREADAEQREESGFFKFVRVVHAVVPRTGDLTVLMTRSAAEDFLTAKVAQDHPIIRFQPEVNWTESLAVSGIFIALMLTLSCWWFATRDY